MTPTLPHACPEALSIYFLALYIALTGFIKMTSIYFYFSEFFEI
jgi:hypothetical protein